MLENPNYMLEFLSGLLWSRTVPLAIQREVAAVLAIRNYVWRLVQPKENKNQQKGTHYQQRKAGMDLLIHTEGKCSAFLRMSTSGENLLINGS